MNVAEGTVTLETLWFFQFVFCAVSLAIVWGTTLERVKFGVYMIYAIVFSALIYPIGAHWIFGGGWLATQFGMQDFAGSTVVHLIGATGALAVLLLLGPRRGKYGADKKPRAIPGHNMPLFGLGILILWLGWFGFNPGSGLNALDGRFPEIAMVTNLAAAAGVLVAVAHDVHQDQEVDIGMAGNGAIAGLVAITAPSGYVELWAAPIIGAVAGVIVVFGVLAIDKKIDDPVGALSAHGLAGVWGTLACGLFAAPRLVEKNAVGDPACSTAARSTSCSRGARRRVRLRVRVRVLVHHVLGDQEDLRPPRVRPRKRTPDWTFPSTACTGIRSSSSRLRNWSGTRRPRRRSCPADRGALNSGGSGMKKIEAYIRHEAFEPIRMELLRAGVPVPDDLGGQGLRAAEGDHRALPRRRADQLAAAEGQARVRRGQR